MICLFARLAIQQRAYKTVQIDHNYPSCAKSLRALHRMGCLRFYLHKPVVHVPLQHCWSWPHFKPLFLHVAHLPKKQTKFLQHGMPFWQGESRAMQCFKLPVVLAVIFWHFFLMQPSLPQQSEDVLQDCFLLAQERVLRMLRTTGDELSLAEVRTDATPWPPFKEHRTKKDRIKRTFFIAAASVDLASLCLE